jgi:hypothetical protein
MIRFAVLAVMALAGASLPAQAQQSATPPNQTTPTTPSGAPTNPDLTVATVKLQGGLRASKLIGSAVYNDQNQKVGSVDDLILKDDDRITMAIVSVGGFLGMGNKLVAVPYAQLHLETNKDEMRVTMPGAGKDALNAMPTFTYGG